MTIRYVVSAAALVGLTACGGGGGTLGGGAAATYIGYANELNDFLDGGLEANAAPHGVGKANYQGVMMVATDLNPAGGSSATGYLGEANITMNFVSGTFTGTANQFLDIDINTVTGRPEGYNTGPNADGTVVSTNVMFTATGVSTSDFNPEFSGSIDGKELDGTGSGLFRGTNGEQVSIFDDTVGCTVCDFLFDGVPGDVTIIAD